MLELRSRECPSCSSKDKVLIGKPRKVDELFSDINDADVSKCNIVQCKSCSLYFVDPFPFFSKELLEKMYSSDNNYFPELTDKMERILHVENPERRFDMVERYSRGPIKNYLEIGCGQGFGLRAAIKRGWNVSGQDVSPDFAEIVKANTNIDILVGQLKQDSYPEGMFDFIYVDSVLEHVPNPVEYLSLIRRFLSPQGILYLILPNEGSIPNRFMDLALKVKGSKVTSRIMPFSEPYHILGFTKKSIGRIADLTGLEVRFLQRKNSYNHVERYKQPFSFPRFAKRTVFGIFHRVSDGLNNGMNMEVLFTKKS